MYTQTDDIAQSLIRKVPKEELYGLSVDTAALFSDRKGVYRRRIEKHQRKLLTKLSFLRRSRTGRKNPSRHIRLFAGDLRRATAYWSSASAVKTVFVCHHEQAHTSYSDNARSAAPMVCCTNTICRLSLYSTEMGNPCREI